MNETPLQIQDEEILTKKEEEIKYILNSIEQIIPHHGTFIALIYNPISGGGEILPSDSISISAFLEGLQVDKATTLLHGPGGDFTEALLIALLFRKKFTKYKTLVSSVCGSSLNLIALKSDGLIRLKDSTITQIDPCFVYEEEIYRAIEHLRDDNQAIKDKANEVFHYAKDQLIALIKEKPSLFDHEKVDFEFFDWENIVELMMQQERHDSEVKSSEIHLIPFKLEFTDDAELKNNCEKLIQKVTDYLIVTGRRFFIGTTQTIEINKHNPQITEKGNLLFCP